MNKEEMKNKETNLKHGYIFLASTLLVIFALFLSLEIYLKGGFNFTNADLVTKESQEKTSYSEPSIELISLKDGYITEQSVLTVVGKTEKENGVWVNGEKVFVNNEGIFEFGVELIVGKNEIFIEAINPQDISTSLTFFIIREENKEDIEQDESDEKVKETRKDEPVIKPRPETEKPNPPSQPQPPSPPVPTPPVSPPPDTITGLKMSCSITNSYPSVGQSVKLDCTVKDQNDNLINGAIGNATLNWQSGQSVYNFPLTTNGITTVSFTVPEGNVGSISGTIRISKDGLTVVSNFSITVQ